jgi:hypothetical protein
VGSEGVLLLGCTKQNGCGCSGAYFENTAPVSAFASHIKRLKISHQACAKTMERMRQIKGNYLRTIGGNEENSVGMKEARLDSKGFVKNGDGHYIAVIETLF